MDSNVEQSIQDVKKEIHELTDNKQLTDIEMKLKLDKLLYQYYRLLYQKKDSSERV